MSLRPRTRHSLPPLLLGLFVALAWGVLTPRASVGQACTHYASPSGSGSACSIGSPCLINSFWSIGSLPGKVLCLNNGTYTGGNSMILPPLPVSGTAGNPITVRALNDGQVLLDAQGGQAVWLGWASNGNENAWFVIDGINAKNGGNDGLYLVTGSDNILRRVIGWDGTDGAFDSNIFRIIGYRSRAVDCAGWGMNSRKIFDGAQSGNLDGAGYKRCWGEWNDWPDGGSWPSNTYQLGYNTFNQLFENIIGTTRVLGDTAPGDHEGVMRGFHGTGIPPFDMQGTRLLGGIFYTTPGVSNMGDALLSTDECASLYIEDLAMIVDPARGTSVQPMYNTSCIVNGQCFSNVCQNCLSVHDGAPIFSAGNSGWSFPNLHEGNGLAAATGGTSAFVLLPGICKRYENGSLTSQPLWPWPMNQRILDARSTSGYAAVNVTTTIESILGTIPSTCRSDAGGDVTPPTVSITAPAPAATVSGTTVSVTANATDDIGVVGVQFKLDGANLGAEDTTSTYGITWNSTLVGNGSHTLTAVARDAAGNSTTSSNVVVTVANGDTTPPTVSITAPAPSATVSGTTVSVTANASDNVGVAGVQFKLDGVNLGAEDTTSTYGITWNSMLSFNGSHTLTAVARDAQGNTTTSTGVTVTVTGGISLTVSPTTVSRSSAVTATWANIPSPDPYDWIALYVPGAPHMSFVSFVYIDPTHTAGVASGAMNFPIPDAPFAAGTYELRLFRTDFFSGYLGSSNTFTVTAGVSLLGEPTILGVTGNTSITFLAQPTILGVTGNTVILPLAAPTILGVTGNTTITFLAAPTILGVTGNTTITFLAEPTILGVTP